MEGHTDVPAHPEVSIQTNTYPVGGFIFGHATEPSGQFVSDGPRTPCDPDGPRGPCGGCCPGYNPTQLADDAAGPIDPDGPVANTDNAWKAELIVVPNDAVKLAVVAVVAMEAVPANSGATPNGK